MKRSWWSFFDQPTPDPIYEATLAMDAARVVEAQMKANQKEMIRRALEREKPMRDFLEHRMTETSWDKKVRLAKERRNIAKAETKRRRAMQSKTVEFDFPTTAIENSMRHEWERPLRNGMPPGAVARALVEAALQAFDLTPADLFEQIRMRKKNKLDLVVSIRIRCTEAQFARFMIVRNDNGGCNSFKELAPRYIPDPAPEPKAYIDVRPRA